MTTTANRPKVGIAVFILRRTPSSPTQSEFVLGLRKGSHGSGTWALPGGHLEYSESFETCAAREVAEETGLSITNIRFLTATNDVFETESKHYCTVFVVAEVDGNGEEREPRVLEPEKCERWEWVAWETLKGWVEEEGGKVFLPLVNLMVQRPEVVPLL